MNVTVTVPAEVAAPVITSPTTGSTVRGGNVTFTGTGIAGANIILVVVQSDAQMPPDRIPGSTEDDQIVVDANGNWTVTVPLAPYTYVAGATHTTAPAGAIAGGPLSLPSELIEFTLAANAAPVVTPDGAPQLAATGGTSEGFIGLGARARECSHRGSSDPDCAVSPRAAGRHPGPTRATRAYAPDRTG